MSVQNAIHRRRTPQSRKRHEHRRKGKKSRRWSKCRLKKWTRFKRQTSRLERYKARRQLTRLRKFHDADLDTIVFKQVRPRRKHLLCSLRRDQVTDKVRTFRHRRKARRLAETAALHFLD
jgi:hypothetical protein